jgi:hypothetical protein
MRKTVLLSTVALLAGIGMASAQAPGQAQSGSSSGAQTQRHEGSSAQQTKEQPGQARHEQGMTQGKSGTAAQPQPQRNEGKAQHEQTTGQNVEKQKPAARTEGNRERTTGQGGQAASQPQQGQTEHKPGQQAQQPQQPQQGRSGQQAQQPQQSTQGRSSQQTQQRQLSPQQGQTTTGAASQQQGQAKSGATAQQQQTGQAGRAGNATVTLNESQRTRIRETVLARSDVPRVDRVDFALTVGTFVPERVHLVAVPEELIVIRPEWREDMYFVSGDDIIIVDHSHRIVAVVAAGPTTAMNSREYSSYASMRGTSVNLSTEEIRQLQIALNEKGFNVGEPDGVMGSRTRQALIAFQRQQGFQATGQLDQQTLGALRISGNNNAGAGSMGQGGAASSTGQGGTVNQPAASQNGSSNRGNMPAATSGQGTSGSTNMPSHTQGSSGGSTSMPSHTQGSSGGTNLPSGQSK